MRILSIVPLFALIACGVADGKKLSEMDEGDWKSLCQSLESEEVTATCTVQDSEIEVTVGGTAEDCATENNQAFPDSCEATVGDVRDCEAALYLDPCLLFSEEAPESCVAFFSCAFE